MAATFSEVIAAQVKELREKRNLSYRGLARKVSDLGHSLDASGVMRLEAGDRRITVADLIALALALDVTPVDLMVPMPSDEVEVPGRGTRKGTEVFSWMSGKRFPEDRDLSQMYQLELTDDELHETVRAVEDTITEFQSIREKLTKMLDSQEGGQ